MIHKHKHIKVTEEIVYLWEIKSDRRKTTYQCSCGDKHDFFADARETFPMPEKIRIENCEEFLLQSTAS